MAKMAWRLLLVRGMDANFSLFAMNPERSAIEAGQEVHR